MSGLTPAASNCSVYADQTMAEVLAKAHDFPPSVAGDKAAAFAVSIADYKTLKLPQDDFNFIDIQHQRDVLAEHARKRFEFLTLRNSISYIRQHPEDFDGVNDALLATRLQKVTDAINKMEEEASACLQDAHACKFTPFDVSDFPLPQAKPGVKIPPAPVEPTVATIPNVRLMMQEVPGGFVQLFWFKNVGDNVALGEILYRIMHPTRGEREIGSPATGILTEIMVPSHSPRHLAVGDAIGIISPRPAG
jgi:hypothetical protein